MGSTLAEWLGRTQIERFAGMIAGLVLDVPKSESGIFGRIAAMAIGQTPSARDPVATALAGAGASERAWREFLSHLGLGVDILVLQKGLASQDAAVREATIWFLVTDSDRLTAPGATQDLKGALNPPGAELPPDETAWALFGRELLARRLGKSNPVEGLEAIKRHGLTHWSDSRALADASELTHAERAALREIMPDLPASLPATGVRPRTAATTDSKRTGPRTRTFPAIAPGFLGSHVDAVGCTLPSNPTAFGSARMSFHPDGRPRTVSVDTTTLPESCAEFVKFLAMLTVAQPDQAVLEGESQWLFISADRVAINCVDSDMPALMQLASAQRVSAGRVKVPRRIKDVRPVYPESMLLERVQATVIESVITRTGCVAGSEVLRSVALPLDFAALGAVSNWRYGPTLLDGSPVPVIMIQTVTFSLQ